MSRKRTVNIGTAKMVYLYESSIGRGICLLQRRLAAREVLRCSARNNTALKKLFVNQNIDLMTFTI